MSTPNKQSKSQAAIDMGWLTRIEAAEYLGMSYGAFKIIAGRIKKKTIGSNTYYDKKDLLAYLANIQKFGKKNSQLIDA